MPSSLPVIFAFCTLSAVSSASKTEYLGMYFNGSKVGYSSYEADSALYKGKKALRTVSVTEIQIKMMGADTHMHMKDVTFASPDGHLLRLISDQDSAGRTQHIEATFGVKTVDVTINNSGTVTHRTVAIPVGAKITDDPMEGLVFNKMKPGKSSDQYVFDTTTISFIKTTLIYKGRATVKVHNKTVSADLVKIRDSRADSDVYCKPNGDIVKVEVPLGPLGIEMYPETKNVAMSGVAKHVEVDLASGTKITPVGDLGFPDSLTDLKLSIRSSSLTTLPNDGHQSVTSANGEFRVDVHPPQVKSAQSTTIAAAAAAQPDWIKPDVNVPSDAPRFKTLAQKLIGGETDALKAAEAIQRYVNSVMQPDASIAVLRDANEVLDSKRGVCRDYAILTATLLRAAGIPTRLVTGLVSWDTDFYYHAWVSIFDGHQWIGIDSTTSEPQISAAHVELASGSLAEAFAAPVLQHPTVKVLSKTGA